MKDVKPLIRVIAIAIGVLLGFAFGFLYTPDPNFPPPLRREEIDPL